MASSGSMEGDTGSPPSGMSFEECREEMNKVLHNGQALRKFHAMLLAQGVKKEDADTLCLGDEPLKAMGPATFKTQITSKSKGTVVALKAVNIAT